MTFALDKFRKFLPAATFAMAAEFLMELSHIVICGHVIGETGLSVATLMQPAKSLLEFFAFLVGTGSSVLYAVEMEKSGKRRAREFLTQGLWSALMFGGALAILFAAFRGVAPECLGVDGAVLSGLKEYWLWFIPCVFLEPVSVYLKLACYADGDGKVCTAAYAVQLVCNFVLCAALTMRFGFAGCAFAAAVGHVAAILVLCAHFPKRANSLGFVAHFSFADTWKICKCAIGDASSQLCQAALMLALDLYVVARFGAGTLPVLAVAIAVLSLSEVFNGVATAMQPIANVYIGEKNDRLTKRIFRYASVASAVEGLAACALLVAAPSLVPRLVGLHDPALVAPSETAVRIVALSLVGSSLVALFNSYWTFIGKEMLASVLTVLAMLAAPVALFTLLGSFSGLCGVWAGLALAPYLALAICAAAICLKWGKDKFPLFLDRNRIRRTKIYDLELDSDAICAVSTSMSKFLAVRKGFDPHKASLTALLVEETLMLVMERNASRRIRAEVSLVFSSSDIRLTIRDDGEIFDITDADAKISSLRSYLVANLMVAIPAKRNMTTTGFNRNAFKI